MTIEIFFFFLIPLIHMHPHWLTIREILKYLLMTWLTIEESLKHLLMTCL